MRLRGDFAANHRLLVLSGIALGIGAVATGAAWLLLSLIRAFTNLFFFGTLSIAFHSPAEHRLGAWAILIPALGGLIVGLMARYGSERIRGHGIPEALEAILFGKSVMQPKVAVLKPVSAAIAIGSGGPFGAEGPIIMTGGAFGSLLAQAFHLTAAERKTLLVAGASAGMTAVFGTPVAAVLLAVELLLFEWKPRSLVPVAFACAVAAGLRPFVMGPGVLFPVSTGAVTSPAVLLAAAVSGLIAGAFSAFLTAALYKVEDAFGTLKIHWMWWPALAGLVVGVGGWLRPRALGVGYDVIADLLHLNIPVAVVAGLIAVKCVIWLVSLGSGTSGGVLAPLLTMGAALGAIEAQVFPGEPMLWPLVSMAAILGGMMRVPFCAVIFGLELTNDLDALPALFVAAITAYGFTVLAMKRSILTEKVARRGYDLFREYTVDPLERARIGEVMTRDPEAIPAALPVEEAMDRFFSGRRKHRGYPVVDGSGALLGVVTVSDLVDFTNGNLSPGLLMGDVIRRPAVVGYPAESCRAAAERMAAAAVGRLPVVDPAQPSRLLGIVTRSDLLKPRLHHLEEEQRRERIPWRRPA